ncbi:MAG: type II toxin-antitoxin system HicB family antitoxin [Lachnospiraceae bacterium]|nr:type II toxin-antitoxin system HicB family antitoxin [Lachnospiraceae bacterium]
MLSVYPACFFKEENGYSVFFPDLDLDTCGETKDEAMAMAVDCLAGRLRWLKQDGDPIPAPSPMNTVDPVAVSRESEIKSSETFVNMVSVDVEAYAKEHFDKSVSKTLTIPAWLNTAAVEMNINFSQVLQEALLAKVQAQ